MILAILLLFSISSYSQEVESPFPEVCNESSTYKEVEEVYTNYERSVLESDRVSFVMHKYGIYPSVMKRIGCLGVLEGESIYTGMKLSSKQKKSLLECKRVYVEAVNQIFFTETRKNKMKKIFNFAKKEMLDFLSSFKSKTQERDILDTMIADILKVEIQLEVRLREKEPLQVSKMEFGFNTGWIINPKISKDGNELEFSLEGRILEPGGFIFFVDKNPKLLLTTIWHELAHVIGLHKYRFNSSFTQNPFSSVLKCLLTKESIAARKNDIACMEKNEKFAYLTKAIKRWPESTHIGALKFRGNTLCQQGELDEVWADWLASEVLAGFLKNNQNERPEDFLSIHCGIALKSSESLERLRAVDKNEILNNLKLSYHPLINDRLNKIFLSQPELRSFFKVQENFADYCSM